MPRLIDADEAYKVLTDYYHQRTEIQHKALKEAIERVPTVEAVPVAELPYTVWLTHDVVQVVRCKNCKYFHYNKVYDIQGFSIMGNSVCDKWANGCRTDENGYCFLGERKEDVNIS